MENAIKSLYVASVLVSTLALGGCGSSGGSSSGTPQQVGSLSGTAAVGQAITDASVTAQCQNGSNFTATVMTNADGAWSGEVGSDSFPCVVTVTGGTPAVTLRSYASAGGTLNITPLTDLALTIEQATDDFSWIDDTNLWPTASELGDTINTLLSELSENGYNIPLGNPFSTPFVIGDQWDSVLDDLAAAIAESSSIENYAALAVLLKDGNYSSIPAGPHTSTSPTGDGAALAGKAGATGSFKDTTYTFTESTVWTENPLTNSGGFIAYGPTVESFWKVDRLIRKEEMIGVTQHCGTDPDSSVSIGLQLPSTSLYYANPIVSACALILTEVSEVGFKAKFSATLQNAASEQGTVVDGYLIYTGESDPVDPEPTGNSVIFNVGDVSKVYEKVSCSRRDNPDRVFISLGETEVIFDFVGSKFPESGTQYTSTTSRTHPSDTDYTVRVEGYVYEYNMWGLFYSGVSTDFVASVTVDNDYYYFKGTDIPTGDDKISFEISCKL